MQASARIISGGPTTGTISRDLVIVSRVPTGRRPNRRSLETLNIYRIDIEIDSNDRRGGKWSAAKPARPLGAGDSTSNLDVRSDAESTRFHLNGRPLGAAFGISAINPFRTGMPSSNGRFHRRLGGLRQGKKPGQTDSGARTDRASWPTDSFPKRNKLACPSKGGRLRGGLENDTGNQKNLGLDRCCLGGHNRRVSNTLGCRSWAKTTSNNVVESGLRPRAHSSGYAWPGALPKSGVRSQVVPLRLSVDGGLAAVRTARERRSAPLGDSRGARSDRRGQAHFPPAVRSAGPWRPRSERLMGSTRTDTPFADRSFLPASDVPQD